MHYCLNLFTKHMPTEEEIENIMEPYRYTCMDVPYIITWDWYVIGGRWSNSLVTKSTSGMKGLRCDGAPVSELDLDLSDLECFCFIDMDGNGLAREVWNGYDFVEIRNFDDLYHKTLEESKDGYLTVIDIHN